MAFPSFSPEQPIICAIDTADLNEAIEMVSSIRPFVGGMKLGLEFFLKNGPEGVRAIAKMGVPLFLDLKLHDIPNQVAGALESTLSLGIHMLTIHTLGGAEMMRAAADRLREAAEKKDTIPPLLLGVTVLTSMDAEGLRAIGCHATLDEQVLKLATLAKESGLDGVICSPHEIAILKETLGKDFILVVPGIRMQSDEHHDQKRVMTPKEAVGLGADYLVIGRAITAQKDPIQAAKNIVESLSL